MMSQVSSQAMNANRFQDFGLSEPRLQKRKHVLLIEDDIDFSELVSAAMSDVLDLSVDTAADPFEAMEKMTEGEYDALVLDWSLPQLNGAETLRRTEVSFFFESELPERWKAGPVPVIVISAHSQEHFSFQDSPHFHVLGFVSKRQELGKFLNQLQRNLDDVLVMGVPA